MTAISVAAGSAWAVELEVMHWWTSGGEAAAVAEFARHFEERTDHTWVDGAIAGGGAVARPIMVSRILGGDPMGAFQFNHGRQAEELIEAGLLLDLTDVAEAQGWRDIVRPSNLLDACTVDGRIYCVPVNIHSWQWLWLSHKAFEDAGLEVPSDWFEFVEAAPALREAGKIPLALGGQPWQSTGAFNVMAVAIAGPEAYAQVMGEKNAEVARGEDYARVFEAAVAAREMAQGSNVQEWQQATNLVITGQAGGQIMGDWAQGDFQVAGQVAGEDYSCLPGLGVNEVISAGGDAFYFPVHSDPAVTEAQKELAALLLDPEVQVDFNLAKGSLPVRGDVNLDAANDCMRKGLEILAAGAVLPDGVTTLSPDTTGQIDDLMAEFWSTSMTAEQAQERYAAIIEAAD
ncbi:ABC transporter substrate-binding protein [Rubellimicrobium sp. CFH 75288]|uniref:ABC transporter substrate-binding protein n=1 Tax=Rubellimicrobium sp. CFH 75288 TaxID=2697034 RepID=UPI001412D612|nr:ABC transporter substrate-binding protein [Rubellimicrobium sp. CFH 75288]NAZ38020.1 extracellular solute-binding protein [Rubellimicrobium sp. CFH 75288]